MDPALKAYLDRLQENLNKANDDLRSDIKQLAGQIDHQSAQVDDLTARKPDLEAFGNSKPALEHASTPAASQLLLTDAPASPTTTVDVFPVLTASSASAKPLDIDATGVAAPMPTTCSTDGTGHDSGGNDSVAVSLLPWGTIPSFTAPLEASLTQPCRLFVALELDTKALTRCSTMCFADDTMVFKYMFMADVTQSITRQGQVIRPIPWPSFKCQAEAKYPDEPCSVWSGCHLTGTPYMMEDGIMERQSFIVQSMAGAMELQAIGMLCFPRPPAKPPEDYDECILLSIGIQAITLASYPSSVVTSCSMFTGWPCELINARTGSHSTLRNTKQLIGANLCSQQQKNTINLLSYSCWTWSSSPMPTHSHLDGFSCPKWYLRITVSSHELLSVVLRRGYLNCEHLQPWRSIDRANSLACMVDQNSFDCFHGGVHLKYVGQQPQVTSVIKHFFGDPNSPREFLRYLPSVQLKPCPFEKIVCWIPTVPRDTPIPSQPIMQFLDDLNSGAAEWRSIIFSVQLSYEFRAQEAQPMFRFSQKHVQLKLLGPSFSCNCRAVQVWSELPKGELPDDHCSSVTNFCLPMTSADDLGPFDFIEHQFLVVHDQVTELAGSSSLKEWWSTRDLVYKTQEWKVCEHHVPEHAAVCSIARTDKLQETIQIISMSVYWKILSQEEFKGSGRFGRGCSSEQYRDLWALLAYLRSQHIHSLQCWCSAKMISPTALVLNEPQVLGCSSPVSSDFIHRVIYCYCLSLAACARRCINFTLGRGAFTSFHIDSSKCSSEQFGDLLVVKRTGSLQPWSSSAKVPCWFNCFISTEISQLYFHVYQRGGPSRMPWDSGNQIIANLESHGHWQDDVQCKMTWDPGFDSVYTMGIECSYFPCHILSGLSPQVSTSVFLQSSIGSPFNGYSCPYGFVLLQWEIAWTLGLEFLASGNQSGQPFLPPTLISTTSTSKQEGTQGGRCDIAPATFRDATQVRHGYCIDHAYYYFDQVPDGHNYYLGTFLKQVSSGYDHYVNSDCFFDLVQDYLNHCYYRDDYHGNSGVIEDLQAPWDPGEFFVATAWGQAVSQDGGGVSSPTANRPEAQEEAKSTPVAAQQQTKAQPTTSPSSTWTTYTRENRTSKLSQEGSRTRTAAAISPTPGSSTLNPLLAVSF